MQDGPSEPSCPLMNGAIGPFRTMPSGSIRTLVPLEERCHRLVLRHLSGTIGTLMAFKERRHRLACLTHDGRLHRTACRLSTEGAISR
jgi:hypothetical protein